MNDEPDIFFADPNPQRVPQVWLDWLHQQTATEDPDFVMPL